MVFTKNMESVLNEQINAEMYSAYLYLAMSADLDNRNLKGFANWMKVQAQEEMSHAMKLYNYIIERGGKPLLTEIKGPQTEWESVLKIFEGSYKHEKMITGMIDKLVEIASNEKDYATSNMLQWFVNEQVEEEANASEIVEKLKMIGESSNALFMIDKELGQRVFVDDTNKE